MIFKLLLLVLNYARSSPRHRRTGPCGISSSLPTYGRAEILVNVTGDRHGYNDGSPIVC
jgi:hypothetical protein